MMMTSHIRYHVGLARIDDLRRQADQVRRARIESVELEGHASTTRRTQRLQVSGLWLLRAFGTLRTRRSARA